MVSSKCLQSRIRLDGESRTTRTTVRDDWREEVHGEEFGGFGRRRNGTTFTATNFNVTSKQVVRRKSCNDDDALDIGIKDSSDEQARIAETFTLVER
jgi:hypothetical protein